MGYTKKWIPPTIPLRDDLTAWKALFKDVHDNLIAAGLVQSGTAGQLDIDGVSALPADGTYAGFVEYEFNDALQATAPVVIKLEYGCDASGLYSSAFYNISRCPRIRATVSFAGGSVTFGCPQTYSPSSATVTTQATLKGVSYLCANMDVGFVGCVYGAGSRDVTRAGGYGTYVGATLTLLVARSTTAAGVPTADGVRVFCPGIDISNNTNLWTAGVVPVAYSRYIDSAGAVSESRELALRLGGNIQSTIGSEVQTQQVFSWVPELSPWPWIVSYNYLDVPEGTEFSLPVFMGPTTNFIAVGRETSLSVDALVGQRAGIAMLWE